MTQDKNFTIRLKAAIDKKLQETGYEDLALRGAIHYNHYQRVSDAFFESLHSISLDYLQGVKHVKDEVTAFASPGEGAVIVEGG